VSLAAGCGLREVSRPESCVNSLSALLSRREFEIGVLRCHRRTLPGVLRSPVPCEQAENVRAAVSHPLD
jgi:hypothetical protein